MLKNWKAIARIKSEQQRTELLEKAIVQNLSLTKIKELIQQLEDKQDDSEETTQQRLTRQYSEIGKRLKGSKIWSDNRKRKKLEKLLGDLENLLSVD